MLVIPLKIQMALVLVHPGPGKLRPQVCRIGRAESVRITDERKWDCIPKKDVNLDFR